MRRVRAFRSHKVELYYIGTMKDSCQPALDVFAGKGFALSVFASLDEACAALRTAKEMPELIVLDESENRGEPEAMRKAVMALLSINAFSHVAAMTHLDAEVYHDAMEGLGMLSALPCPATAEAGEHLLGELASLLGKTL